MIVKHLSLQGFRNYESLDFVPAPGVNVLCGDNAQGKTNLLEAVHLCCLGRSHRTSKDAELIGWGKMKSSVRLDAQSRDGIRRIEVTLHLQGEKKKTVSLNGSPVQRIGELMGQVNAVLFSPEDLKLVKDGPEIRRRFLDMEISQLYPAYFYALQRYVRSLNQRNTLLKKIAEDPSLLNTLDEWDYMLASSGAEIISRRMRYITLLQSAAQEAHDALTGGLEKLTLTYSRNEEDGQESLLRLLKASRKDDLHRMTTSCGPHRDDLRLLINGREVRNFGSQGQQRTAALSLKLAELEVMAQTLGESPILLLDDVMSELDVERRKMLLTRISGVQTLITCTHLSDLGGATADKICHVKNGILDL